jgi:methyltransferase (TIGR00027 family)
MRELHGRIDPEPLFADPWGARLVPPAVAQAIRERALAAMDEAARAQAAAAPPGRIVDEFLRAQPAYAGVILRTRYSEDALAAAAERGCRQLVVIGAGFDSFALRRPPSLAAVEVFEIDHPATQGLKLECMRAGGIERPPATHYVAADLGAEDIASALARTPWTRGEPSFFSWLGVTPYLPREANLATFGAVGRSAAPGSEIVFTYIHRDAFAPANDSAAWQAARQSVAAVGEPWITGFDQEELARDLAALGLARIEDLDGQALAARYAGSGANALLRSSPHGRIAHYRIGA